MTRERAPKPGAHWDTAATTVELLVDGKWTHVGGISDVHPDREPEPYRPNRATRRAMDRAARRRSR